MSIDLHRVRAETPGVHHVAHLNSAGSSLQPQPVVDAVVEHVQLEARIGGYEAAAEAAEAVEAVYDSLAALVGCHRHEIAQADSATAAWNLAFGAMSFRPGDRIITARSEYPSNAVNLLIAHERYEAEIVLIDDDEDGQVSVDALRDAVDDRTVLIALTHVATSGGMVNPVEEVGRIARDAGVTYLLDACQSVGQMVVDVDAIGCDILTAAGRKFLRAPRGTGFLYVRDAVVDSLRPPLLDTRSSVWTGPMTYEIEPAARRFDSFEHNVAARLGLGVAARYATSIGLAAIEERTSMLAASLRDELAGLDGVTVHDKGRTRCGIVTFGVDGRSADEVYAALRTAKVNTSVTWAGMAQFDFPNRGLDRLVRASPHYFNTTDELATLVEVVAGLTPVTPASPAERMPPPRRDPR